MKRLAVLHTVPFLADLFKNMLKERYPDLDAFHMVDESLLQDLMRGGPSPSIFRRIATHAMLARDAGADLLVFTCSSTSPAVDTARQLIDIPIVKIDDAMMEKAVATGTKIGIVCTTTSTKGPSTDLVHAHAAALGKSIDVTTELKADAYQALIGGDRDTHDRIDSEAALV